MSMSMSWSAYAAAMVLEEVPATSARALRVLWSFMVVVTFEPLPELSPALGLLTLCCSVVAALLFLFASAFAAYAERPRRDQHPDEAETVVETVVETGAIF